MDTFDASSSNTRHIRGRLSVGGEETRIGESERIVAHPCGLVAERKNGKKRKEAETQRKEEKEVDDQIIGLRVVGGPFEPLNIVCYVGLYDVFHGVLNVWHRVNATLTEAYHLPWDEKTIGTLVRTISDRASKDAKVRRNIERHLGTRLLE